MGKRSTSAKIWLGLGTCLVLVAVLAWLSHWRAVNHLQAWKARMVAQGERFGVDELAPPLAPYDPNVGELMAAASRLRSHAFDPGYFLSLDFIAPGQARAPWLGTNLAGSYGRGPATWAQVAQELESARDELEAIHAGLENPVPTRVINYHNLGMASGIVVSERAAAQWLACEAIDRMRRNDLAGAQDTLDLDSLAPEFLAAVPVDDMNGQPLHYSVGPDGSFRLYSVGPDGKDDGGNPQLPAGWKSYSSLFDGRDAVWPRLASSENPTAASKLEALPLVQFANAPLPDVIRILARQADLIVRIDPKVAVESLPPVTIRLENMTALGVLETVLKSNGLVLVKHTGTNLVGITTK